MFQNLHKTISVVKKSIPMSDSDSDQSAETLSDNDDSTLKEELDANDVKLQQMRRGAQKRGGQSKIVARFEGLVSYDEMLRQHAFKRMKDGIQKILSLHTPVELSSLCGCLGLKVQEKGSTSIHFITQYASESNDLDAERLKKIMNFMWEGALWEYLHSIGHPIHSMRPDPKKTILEIWEQGGLLGGNVNGFVPHFIAREVKKRNEWIQSADIQERLEKLRKAQDAAKSAERKIISDHDYTNILSYFNQMGALRRLENSVREFLISEVEIVRSRIDSCEESAKMNRKQLAENEQYYMKIVNAINEQLALTEFVCEERITERYKLEGDLQRLSNVMESYIAAEENREMIGGGTMQALKLRQGEECSASVRTIHAQIQQYKQVRDHMDSVLRAQSRAQRTGAGHADEMVEALQAELESLNEHSVKETARADAAERALFFCRRKLAKLENKQKISAHESWGSSARFASHLDHQLRLARSLKPVMIAALNHPHRTVVGIARSVLSTLDLAAAEEMDRVFETACMRRQDALATAVRRAENARRDAMNSPAAVAARSKSKSKVVKKDSKGSKSVGKGSGSVKTTGSVVSKSSRASTPSETSRPASKQAKSGMSSKGSMKSPPSTKKKTLKK